MKICHHFFHKPFKTYFGSVYNFCLTFFPLSTSVELCFDLNEKCPKQDHVCENLVSILCRGGYGSFRRRVLAVRIISMMGELESSVILKLPDYSLFLICGWEAISQLPWQETVISHQLAPAIWCHASLSVMD